MEAVRQRRAPNLRCVGYICCTPRYLATEDTLRKRQMACRELRTSSHWPHKLKLFDARPRALAKGADVPDVPMPPAPRLTEMGRKLAGY